MVVCVCGVVVVVVVVVLVLVLACVCGWSISQLCTSCDSRMFLGVFVLA